MENIMKEIKQFNEERDWGQFHTPENLAKSISIEASELLECFQWDDKNYNLEALLEELADVMCYCIQLGQVLDVDLIDVIHKKIEKNALKYPIEKCKGLSDKYDKLG